MSRDVSPPPRCSDLSDSQQDIRLIGVDGKQRGIMTLSEAMKISEDERVELVRISQTTSPQIYRLIERGEHQKHIE
jgi:translation initiation factor IF-3